MALKEKIMKLQTYKMFEGEDTVYVDRDDILGLLEQEPRKGQWLRMSDLSEQEDNRYKCSRCGNVVRSNNKMNLYTFNRWCGRCGSNNDRHINYEVEE